MCNTGVVLHTEAGPIQTERLSGSEGPMAGRPPVGYITPHNAPLSQPQPDPRLEAIYVENALKIGLTPPNAQNSPSHTFLDLSEGQRVSFVMHDRLLGPFHATGTLGGNIYGHLWLITPDPHPRLSGVDVQIHSIAITPKNSQKIGENHDN